jgi:ribosomal protein L29
MKMSDIKEMSDAQLVHAELKCERDIMDSRFKKQLGTLESTGVFSNLRKSIARLRTEQRRREIDGQMPLDSLRNKYRNSFNPETSDESSAGSGAFLKGISEKLNTDA